MFPNSYPTTRSGPLLAAALCLTTTLMTASPSGADATDDLIQTMMEQLKSGSSLLALIKSCPQYSGLDDAAGCTLAQKAGDGLHCPSVTAVVAPTNTPAEKCEFTFLNKLEATLGANGWARLKSAGVDTAVFKATIVPKESVGQHQHNSAHTPAASCSDKYVERKDSVSMYAAVYQSSKVSAQPPLDPSAGAATTFVAEVNSEQGASAQFSGLFCGWRNHDKNRSCGKEGTEVPSGND